MDHKIVSLTREKHLDHMVKVVPLIVFAYAIQCYFIMKMGGTGFAVDGLLFLGVALVAMICGFVTYDLTHAVNFGDDSLEISISWLGHQKILAYKDIAQINIAETSQTFTNLTLITHDGKKFGFYFVDDADKIKSWLEQKMFPEFSAAA